MDELAPYGDVACPSALKSAAIFISHSTMSMLFILLKHTHVDCSLNPVSKGALSLYLIQIEVAFIFQLIYFVYLFSVPMLEAILKFALKNDLPIIWVVDTFAKHLARNELPLIEIIVGKLEAT